MHVGINEPKIIGYLPMKIIGGTLHWKATTEQTRWAPWTECMPWMPIKEACVVYHSICALDTDRDRIFVADNLGRQKSTA
jgi:hypothetical protein